MSEPLAYLVGYLYRDLQARADKLDSITNHVGVYSDEDLRQEICEQGKALRLNVTMISRLWDTHFKKITEVGNG